MIKMYVECTFKLDNGSTHKVKLNDVKDDITYSEISELADLLIEKESHYKGSLLTSLEKCVKYTVDEETLN